MNKPQKQNRKNRSRLLMNNQEIFTPDERNENFERKRELIDLVASGEAVLMVGAGSSARVGYVTWDGLLEKLENLAIECGEGFEIDNLKREKSPLEYTEDIKTHIRDKCGDLDRYYGLLQKDLFSPKEPPFTDFHKKLVSLPFRGILTTNYDTVLEAALGEIEPKTAYDNSFIIDDNSVGRIHEFVMSMNNDKRTTRRIAHLHGKFDLVNSIILSIEDYQEKYGLSLDEKTGELQSEIVWTLHRKLLWSVLATRRVVFIGFSMNDPYFNKMLETVSADLWRWDESIHYAIMSINSKNTDENTETSKADVQKDEAQRLKREYGVVTVFYEKSSDDSDPHKGLEQIIEEIYKVCENENQPTTDETDEKDWLEIVNQNMEEDIGNEN